MSELTINPIDFATTFTFPVKGRKDARYEVRLMRRNGLWMICHTDAERDVFDVFAHNGSWKSILTLDNTDPVEIERISFERDRAIALAHRYAVVEGKEGH